MKYIALTLSVLSGLFIVSLINIVLKGQTDLTQSIIANRTGEGIDMLKLDISIVVMMFVLSGFTTFITGVSAYRLFKNN